MKRLTLLIALVAGCSGKPCAVTSECGSGEACVAAHCAALSCSDTTFVVDPSTGACTPVSGCVDHSAVDGWKSCSDPCAGLGESACKQQPSCQATYTTDGQPFGCGDAISCSAPGTFRSCRAVPQLINPCKSLDATACSADGRCELQAIGGTACGCPPGAVCNCPTPPAGPTCGLKSCTELSGDSCEARPDCTTTPQLGGAGSGGPGGGPQPVASGTAGSGTTGSGTTGSGTTGSGTTQPQLDPIALACSSLGNCFNVGERDCLMQRACRPLYLSDGSFSSCTSQDFTRYCGSAADCNTGERCNANGVCVTAGCGGENEAECNADRHCEPIYALQCSPYANGGGPAGGDFCGPGGGTGGTGGGAPPLPNEAPAPPTNCSCEPTFSGCQAHGGGCDPGRSVMVRDPAILDDPFWALPRVLAAVTGADASVVADGWLAQLGTATTIDGKASAARPGAAQFIAALPRRADGVIDASQLGFVPTSLSNRIDLADGTSCGEARITYALAGGVTDRRHRMTVIVELRQPDDGARCRTTAQTWIGLSALDGAALQSALQAIYTPLLTPANLKQVRTNEFLVGPQDPTQPPAAWELREFHLGSDALLHQTLLPLQIDPAAVASSPDFLAWAQANSDGLKRGTVTFPTQYQMPTGSEDGVTVTLSDPAVSDLVNRSTCAGCHTTATNSAFAHVAERFAGTGRAEISQFLAGELQKRATHLGLVASGAADAVLDVRPMH